MEISFTLVQLLNKPLTIELFEKTFSLQTISKGAQKQEAFTNSATFSTLSAFHQMNVARSETVEIPWPRSFIVQLVPRASIQWLKWGDQLQKLTSLGNRSKQFYFDTASMCTLEDP